MVSVPGISGEWEVVDHQRGYTLLRSVQYGHSVPMLVLDREMNLVKETRASLPVAMGWDRGSRKGVFASFNRRSRI